MALCGIFISGLRNELEIELSETRLTKIQEPALNELLLTFKSKEKERRLFLSVNASLPLVYLTEEKKESPATAPAFLMVLRKYLQNARLLSVSQPSLERILIFTFEHADDLGDLKIKKLIVEMMGKYSNIILTDDDDMILDAIRHVTPVVSSLRTVLPGLRWFIPPMQEKKDALTETENGFISTVKTDDTFIFTLTQNYIGFAKETVSEFLIGEGLHPDTVIHTEADKSVLYAAFSHLMQRISETDYRPQVVFREQKPVAYGPFELNSYSAPYRIEQCASFSDLLHTFYYEKNRMDTINSRTIEFRKVLKTLLERETKKMDLYRSQLSDAEKMDRLKLYGELLMANQYALKPGKTATVLNYYDGSEITVPMDETLSPLENANRYYAKYQKLKRTKAAVTDLLKTSEATISHLSSIMHSLNVSETENELSEIRLEMEESGYLRHQNGKGRVKAKASKPHHYLSSDGFHIYVGKNNIQNELLTLKTAGPRDLFFHVKNAPGSHVVLMTEGREVPDRAYEEAGALAAYYSSQKDAEKVEIDYCPCSIVKKPQNGPKGLVIYHSNYSLMAKPDISHLEKLL